MCSTKLNGISASDEDNVETTGNPKDSIGQMSKRDRKKLKQKEKNKEKKEQMKKARKRALKELAQSSKKKQKSKQNPKSNNSDLKFNGNQNKQKGHAVNFHGKFSNNFLQSYLDEKAFIGKVMKRVPKYGQEGGEDLEDYLLESESDNEVSQDKVTSKKSKRKRQRINKNKNKKSETESITQDESEANEEEEEEDDDEKETEDSETLKRQQFLESLVSLKKDKKDNKANVNSRPSREELKAKLAARLEELRKSKERTSLKPKKKKKKKEKISDEKTKQFISKSNPNLSKKSNKNSSKDDVNSISSNASSTTGEQKTPLRKPVVVKSNGQVVYSKFDFISDDKYYNTKQYDPKNKKNAASKPNQLLKKVEKYENKVDKLETSGKTSEALALTEDVKWKTAMKRAKGEKVRDDPSLLKKTIKKDIKLKDAKRKKWNERKEHVEQQKKKIQDKRVANIQQRKDEKKKRALKLQRKRGRIA